MPIPIIIGGIAVAVAVVGCFVALVIHLSKPPPSKTNLTVARIEQTLNKNSQVLIDQLKETEEELEKTKIMLKKGIAPDEMPTKEQYEKAKEMLNDPDGKFYHFAVAGISGSGKSSLINALRGVKDTEEEKGAAKVGNTETTLEVERYPDQNSIFKYFVWYDIPGAGTTKTPSWQYFNDQGLFIFDFVIITINDRITETDIRLLQQCKSHDPPIPTFIVRSKADSHIRNIEDSQEVKKKVARNIFITATREDVEKQLAAVKSDYSKKSVYIVSARILRNFILMANKLKCFTKTRDKTTSVEEAVNVEEAVKVMVEDGDKKFSRNETIDEFVLIKDLLQTAKERRL